ncbi:hypothetical protein K466DRAFT_7291 [Polyporus arcularius HHB13444]|uniref:Uncharacterized protein n=1 Tax=Polyporus arcularius HHB13444 TaxID=1314778 RepID=A0A5C3PJB8_9APHY|nr:hypothetical protein K466DRAFT_7291 [Polyporus arcularius HHB13444]
MRAKSEGRHVDVEDNVRSVTRATTEHLDLHRRLQAEHRQLTAAPVSASTLPGGTQILWPGSPRPLHRMCAARTTNRQRRPIESRHTGGQNNVQDVNEGSGG